MTGARLPGAFEDLQRRLGAVANFRVSSDVPGPVTFGFLRPVIFLPESCVLNESIACHELVHVRRRDWLFTVAEECILSVFWFHPAMWWLVAEIQLAREEAVDREVVGLLDTREHYLQFHVSRRSVVLAAGMAVNLTASSVLAAPNPLISSHGSAARYSKVVAISFLDRRFGCACLCRYRFLIRSSTRLFETGAPDRR